MFDITPKALYRFPQSSTFFRIEQSSSEPIILDSFEDVGKHDGFLLAPFSLSCDNPLLLIRPDIVSEREMVAYDFDATTIPDTYVSDTDALRNKKQYAEDFDCFHQQLCDGKLQKIVLARSSDEMFRCGKLADNTLFEVANGLFYKACSMFPNQFVALIASPLCGYWLMATPEVLLTLRGKEGRSMALAGTMRIDDEESKSPIAVDLAQWTNKNREEQALVTHYIAESLNPLVSEMNVSDPHTVAAANVCHLQTDFTFRLKDEVSLGNVLATLHPTPAVCGLPKAQAFRCISANEHCKRAYYSGFAGPVGINNTASLFVSLRCMQILPDRFRLFAGGGLLKESVMEQEWKETCAKMQAMKSLFA